MGGDAESLESILRKSLRMRAIDSLLPNLEVMMP
jgi:hypothetical protein